MYIWINFVFNLNLIIYIFARATYSGVSCAKTIVLATATRKPCVLPRAKLDFCFANRAENLRYQFKQGQNLLPQFRKIICLVKVGRDTRTRCITVAEDFCLFETFLYTVSVYSKTELESQGDDRSLDHHCGQGNRPMSFRGVKRRGNPLNRNENTFGD